MLLPFTKMQGAGNDFVMINAVDHPVELTAELVRRLSNRTFGIGCDQLLVVEKSAIEGVDFKYRIFNCDGAEVQMCGNGARCFVVFVRDEKLTDKSRIRCETKAGIIEPEWLGGDSVRVNMGLPHFEPESLPFLCDGVSHLSRDADTLYQIRAAGEDNWISLVSMGNPHAVKVVGDTETADVQKIGAAFQKLPQFPEAVNVGFLQVVNRGRARLRVFERGVGETLACGTGACAAAVAGMRRGSLDEKVQIEMRGGVLTVEWSGRTKPESPVYLTGPAQIVFRGMIEI